MLVSFTSELLTVMSVLLVSPSSISLFELCPLFSLSPATRYWDVDRNVAKLAQPVIHSLTQWWVIWTSLVNITSAFGLNSINEDAQASRQERNPRSTGKSCEIMAGFSQWLKYYWVVHYINICLYSTSTVRSDAPRENPTILGKDGTEISSWLSSVSSNLCFQLAHYSILTKSNHKMALKKSHKVY